MANYQLLKADIDEKVYQNGKQEITGENLNSVLNQMVNILGTGYQFTGVATIDTNPGTPDAKVFYIANGKGTYTNFGGLEVTEDEVVVLYWDSSWHKVSTGIASQEKLTELGRQVIYDVTENNDGATFASLSALLSDKNLSTLIPVAVRCGGMNIRFVQTSANNKYVQYRLIATTFTTDVSDWQGVDTTPTANSKSCETASSVNGEYAIEKILVKENNSNTVVEGLPKLDTINGLSIIWNQLVDTNTTTLTIPLNHKYIFSDNGVLNLLVSDGNPFNVTGTEDKVFDLTLMLVDSYIKSVDDFIELFPLALDSTYCNRAVVSSKVTSIISNGYNQWNEMWENGIYSSGNKADKPTAIRSKYLIPVIPNTWYTITAPVESGNIRRSYFDKNKSFISQVFGSAPKPTPANCHYMAFSCENYGTEYHNDICIYIYNTGDGKYKQYQGNVIDINTSSIKDINDNIIFPDGMIGMLDTYDYIKPDEDGIIRRAYKVWDKRTYVSGDENDTSLITDMTNTYYKLSTPIQYILKDVINGGLVKYRQGITFISPYIYNENGIPNTTPVRYRAYDPMNLSELAHNVSVLTKSLCNSSTINIDCGQSTFSELGNCRSITIDGEYCYIGFDNTFRKIHRDVKGNITLIGDYSIGTTKHTITGIQIDNDYIYIVTRDISSGTKPPTSGVCGYLMVYNKSTLQKVSETELPWKGMSGCLYKNRYIIIPLQLKGFAIYDISTPATPSQTAYYEIAIDGTEFQHVDYWSDNNIDYVVFGGFASGIHIFNITNISTPVHVVSGNTWRNSVNETFSVCVKYPYLYATLAPEYSAQTDNRAKKAIMCFNISNPLNFASTLKMCEIPKQYWGDTQDGDGQPNFIKVHNNVALVNLDNIGVAAFNVNGDDLRLTNIYDLNSFVRPICVSSDGLFAYAFSGNIWYSRFFDTEVISDILNRLENLENRI